METEKTFESALAELEQIVKDLENDAIALDDAMTKYTTAMNLIQYCQEKLDHATAQVNKIVTDTNEVKDFELEEGE